MSDTEQNAPVDLSVLASRAERGEISHIDLIDAFLASTVFVPSTTDPSAGEISPVLAEIDDVEYMIVASSESALEETRDVALFGVPMSGRAIINGMNPQLALMINMDGGAFAMPQGMLDDIRASSGPLG